MALNWGVTDVLAVTKLAWDLYHSCYLVAREAPEEFRQLVNELASLQGVLRSLRDDINSDKSFLQRVGEDRKQTLERCVANCFETLQKLQKLVVKYRELHSDEGFWKRLKWVGKQSEISDLKSKIMVHTCNLSLCMSSIGNSSLNRIENSLMTAMKRQEEKQEALDVFEDEIDETTPLTRFRSPPTSHPDSLNGESHTGKSLHRVITGSTGTTLVDPSGTNVSPVSTPSISEDDVSEFSTLRGQVPRTGWPLSDKSRMGSPMAFDQGNRVLSPSPRTSDDHSIETLRTRRSPKLSFTNGELMTKTNGSPGASNGRKEKDLIEVVADAKRELSIIRQREQSQRPLRIVKQDKDHQPDDDLKEQFQLLAEEELQIRRLNARDWLRVATWWLLKARYNLQAFERSEPRNTRGSISISTHGKSPANQAYVDLLKASWILYTIILKEDNLSSLQMDENRKLFYNLSDGINHEFSLYKPIDTPEKETFMEQHYNIWEPTQPEEEYIDNDDNELLPELKNGRWITVEPEDAGEEDETVLFRTFVNAAIGGKTKRIWSQGSPYMLLLSIKDGESEPQVTISNQSGTLGLSRAFTGEDLQDFDEPTSPFTASHLGTPSKAIPLDFGRMNVAIAFTNDTDLQELMRIPRDYFNAVKRREPRQLQRATETLIFKRSVEVFEMLKASTMKSMSPRQKYQSCDLRVLETTTKEGWRTTRRLVISSSAGERKPWCKEFFLPLSRVQISRSDDGLARHARVKWSDCSHEKVTTDGNYNNIYSYVYDDSDPNIAMSFLFRNSEDATDFQKTVLQLSLNDICSWSANSNTQFVYDISDTDPDPKHYKAFQLVRTSFEWTYSELFFVYRDTDFRYDRAATKIYFPQVYYTDYVSNHADKLYKPTADEPPHFSHCEKRFGNANVEFEDESFCMTFLSSLSGGHELIFSRRAHYITTKPPSRFGKTKSNKGSAEVQLWQKGNDIRLVSRWDERVEDKWMSRSVQRGRLDNKKDSNRASLPRAEFDRGRKIDMANLVARDPKEKTEGRKMAPIIIAFDSVRDQEEFAAALDGNLLPLNKARSALDDLMMM